MNLLNFNDVKFEGRLSNLPTVFGKITKGYIPSKYFVEKYNKGMQARTMDVIYDVLKIYKGTSKSCIGFSAQTKKGYIAAINENNFTTGVMLCKKRDGSLYIKATVVDENDISKAVNSVTEIKKCVLLSLMPVLLSDSEAHEIYDTMSDFLEWDENGDEWLYNDHLNEFAALLNRFSSNVEMRLTTDCSASIQIDDSKVSMLKIAERDVEIDKIYNGKIFFFNNKSVSATSTTVQAPVSSCFDGSFAYNPNRLYSETEKGLLKKVPNSYIIPDYVPEICTFFKESSSFPDPMRVAYLIGPAGTGKTSAAKAICAGLNIPYDHYTCNPGTEIFDFIGQVFPNCGSDEELSFDSIRKKLGLPNTDDVINDPVSAYKAVYGKEPVGYPDEGQIIVEMMQKVIDYLNKEGNNGKSFTYVESGFIRAARLGYGFEIQEIGCVLRPGVAVGLNALLETGDNSFITLPTGEIIRKHPDCTYIFTSNDEYEGTCNLNQSVLDRMALVYRIDNPPKDVMFERIMSNLHFPDEKILKRMIDAVYNICDAAKQKEIRDGVCGFRSLQNWCMAVMIKSKMNNGDITDSICYETGITTVMNKVSQKQEYIDELMSSFTYFFAAPKLV